MSRLSSKRTFFYKKIFPVVWFLVIAGFAVAGIYIAQNAPAHSMIIVPLILIPVFLSLIGFIVMRVMVRDLLDEVWDDGNALVLVKGDAKEKIPLSDILNVSHTYLINPQRITLLLRTPCRFGREVVFVPARNLFFSPFRQSPIALELIRRVHKLDD